MDRLAETGHSEFKNGFCRIWQDGLWNAPTEILHQLGYDCPVFGRTKRWLENERGQKISRLSFDRLKFYKHRDRSTCEETAFIPPGDFWKTAKREFQRMVRGEFLNSEVL